MTKVRVINSETLSEISELNLAIVTRIQGECLIGRSPNSALVLDTPDVSRIHGKFFLEDGNYYFCDLGSRNGSIVNGELAKTNQNYTLKHGDVIRIGEFVLIVEESSKIPEELLAETVFGGFDATVLSGWRSAAKFNTPEVAKPPEPASEPPEVMVQAPEVIVVSELIQQTPEAVSKSELATDEPEIASQSSEEVSEAEEVIVFEEVATIQTLEEVEIPDAIAQELEAVSNISEITYIQINQIFEEPASEVISQAPEEVISEITYIQVPETVSEASEEMAQTSEEEEVNTVHEVTSLQDPTLIQSKEASEVTGVSTSEAVSVDLATQSPEEAEGFDITYIQAHEVLEEEKIFDATTQVPEEVNELKATHIQAPEIVSEVTFVSVPEEESEVSESVTQPPEEESEASEAIAQPLEVVSEAIEEEETSEAVTQMTSDIKEVPKQSLTHAPTAVTESEIITVAFDEATVSEGIAQSPDGVSKAFEIISKKYIALMAHDSKKSELTQFVTQHKEFLSKCLTIATPSISDTLYQHTGVAISQRTPSIPVGGYQTVASLIGTGDILAVIFLRDFLMVQSSQANEEALLRLCNINQVLLATNLTTAEAITHYIKAMVISL